MWKASPALCSYVASTGSYMGALNGCLLRIYSGDEPSSTTADVTNNTLLCEIGSDISGGLQFVQGNTPGTLIKDPSQIWSGNEMASGTATFFRLVESSDDDSENEHALRLQGSVGKLSGDMILSDTSFSAGSPRTIKYFTIVIPSV